MNAKGVVRIIIEHCTRHGLRGENGLYVSVPELLMTIEKHAVIDRQDMDRFVNESLARIEVENAKSHS